MIDDDDHRHGSHAGYVAGCRQECCRAGARRYRYLPTFILRGLTKLHIGFTPESH